MKSFVKDKNGNSIRLHNNGILLKIKGETRFRQIFRFDSGRITKRVTQANVMRIKEGMIGFSYHALQLIATSERLSKHDIVVIFEDKQYEISALEILDKKEFLHFKKTGMELQCYFSLSDMRVRGDKRKPIVTQETLNLD